MILYICKIFPNERLDTLTSPGFLIKNKDFWKKIARIVNLAQCYVKKGLHVYITVFLMLYLYTLLFLFCFFLDTKKCQVISYYYVTRKENVDITS